MEQLVSLVYAVSFFSVLIAFAFAVYLYFWVKSQPVQNKKILEVSGLIRAGANTFMRQEYGVLAKFAGVAAVVILLLLPSPIWTGGFTDNIAMAIAYLAGTAFSALAGKIGILVATLSNGRAAEGASKGIRPAFLIGFRGGAVMGLSVVGFCLLGVMAVLIIAGDASILLGFSFGASSLALFAKAGGGIFTKTADVSADLTGKVELGISYNVGYAVAIALRYVPDVQSDFTKIKHAQEARGIEMSGKASVWEQLKKMSMIIFPLIFSSMDRIDVVSNAMELRGFGKHKKRTWYKGRKLTKTDYMTLAFAAVFMIASLWITFADGNRFYNPFSR